MKKGVTSSNQRAASQRAAALAKSATKPLAPVRKAAQEPVHATRADIRRAVRAVTSARTHADA